MKLVEFKNINGKNVRTIEPTKETTIVPDEAVMFTAYYQDDEFSKKIFIIGKEASFSKAFLKEMFSVTIQLEYADYLKEGYEFNSCIEEIEGIVAECIDHEKKKILLVSANDVTCVENKVELDKAFQNFVFGQDEKNPKVI